MKALAFAQTTISLRSLHRFTGSQKSRLIEAGGTSGCPPTLSRAQPQPQATLELPLRPPSTSWSLHRAQHLPGTAVLPGEPPGHAQGLLSWHCRAHPVLPHLHQVLVGTGVPPSLPFPRLSSPSSPRPSCTAVASCWALPSMPRSVVLGGSVYFCIPCILDFKQQ